MVGGGASGRAMSERAGFESQDELGFLEMQSIYYPGHPSVSTEGVIEW